MEILWDARDVDVLARLSSGTPGPAALFALRRQADALAASGRFDRLLMEDAPLTISLYEHQRAAVLRVLREMHGRAILADEVGLGKTIEAGVILKEYLLRGLIRRALILVPASIVSQWRHELQTSIGIPVAVATKPGAWGEHPIVLASLDTAKRNENRKEISEIFWDLVIIDEAHRLKNRSTVNWQFVNGLKKTFCLLLTATPIQNDLRELYNLVTLLKPGQLKTYAAFKREFTIDKRSPRNIPRLQSLLREVMVRTTRRQTLIRFPKRQAENLLTSMGTEEEAFYRAALSFGRQLYAQLPKRERNLLPLVLLLREACSSPQAALRTLRVMRGHPKWGRLSSAAVWEELEQLLLQVRMPSKVQLIDQVVDRYSSEKLLIFTEFRATQRMLADHLTHRGLNVQLFHGGLSSEEKDLAVRMFQGPSQVLISTEAGGEGRNLQFCHILVNYDLPWNPMRVEQRIGRVHRLGQTRDVCLLNCCTQQTIEAYVLGLLDQKIGLFRQVIGELDIILAEMDDGFESTLGEMILSSRDDVELEQWINAFGGRLEQARRRYQSVHEQNDRLILDPVETIERVEPLPALPGAPR